MNITRCWYLTLFVVGFIFALSSAAPSVAAATEAPPNLDYESLPQTHLAVKTGSQVNTLARDYRRGVIDLETVVPAGRLKVKRSYHSVAWHWDFNKYNLVINAIRGEIVARGTASAGADAGPSVSAINTQSGFGIEHWRILSINRAGVKFLPLYTSRPRLNNESKVFLFKKQRITLEGDIFTWEDEKGNWQRFNAEGKLLSYGKYNRTIATALYSGERCTGWLDGDGTQVFWFDYDEDDNLRFARDRFGRQVEYIWENGKMIQSIDVRGYATTYAYRNGVGALERAEEPGGKVRNIAYNQYGDVSSVTNDEGVGFSFSFDYDKGTREYYAFVRYPSGKAKEVWYDRKGYTRRVDINGVTIESVEVSGRRQWVTNARGLITEQERDEWDNIIRIVHPDGSWETRVYRQPGNVLIERNRNGIITTYEYNGFYERTAVNEAVGSGVARRTEYTYTPAGLLASMTIKGTNGAADATTSYDYDLMGHLVRITDPEGRATDFSDFHPAGNPRTIEDGRGKRRYLTYDNAGNLLTIADHSGAVIATYSYDEAGNRATATNAFNKTYTFGYDTENNLTTITDPLAQTAIREYAYLTQLAAVEDQEQQRTSYRYDLFERIQSITDGTGATITYEYLAGDTCPSCSGGSDLIERIIFPTFIRSFTYDERGRLRSQTDTATGEQPRTTSFTYDIHGNRVSVTDPAGNTTSYNHDELGRVVSETAPDGGRTTYVYDTRDNLMELIDANRHTTRFTYDRSNRQLSETRPGGQRLSYTYDGAGNLKTQTDGNGRHTIHSYDDRTRLTRTDIYEFTGAGAPFKSIDYFYNEADSLTGYDDGATSAVYSYDDLQRRTSETIDYGPFSLSHSYRYYANHQKQSYTDPAGRTRTLSYDEGGRPTGLDLGEAVGEVAITAYEWLRPTRIVLPGGGSITVGYNGLQQPISIDARDPGGNPVMQRTYQYRRTGAIQSQTTAEGQIGYNYDPVERLRGATSPARDERFVYDFLGNRSPDDGAPAWGYNENNQLTGTGTITYGYDDHGNMAVKRRGTSEINFSYTPDNRLAFLTDEAGATIGAYGYDPFGRRLFKEVNGTRTYFFYNDEGLVGEYSATGAELRTYGYHPGAPWSTNPLFVQENGIYYYYLNDHLGTPQKIMSDNGTVVWAATYESFGSATITTATITNNLRFPGQYFDSESGLQYNWHRFYDPTTGRYISADPIGLSGGINLYGYVNGDPVNWIDPEGLDSPGYKQCNDKLQKRIRCEKQAFKKFALCNGRVGVEGAACTGVCAKTCLYFPIGYVACVKTCVSGCGVAGGIGRVECLWELSKDLKKCEDDFPTKGECEC
jgi:RHS repeat-associated protein